VVLDASFVMAVFVPHPKASLAQTILDSLNAANASLVAPTLLLYEVTSGIQKLSHFGRISTAQAAAAFALAEQFRVSLITPDFSLARRALIWSQRLQRASAYDSFYLALAEERGCDLWTAVSRLSNAAKTSWVRLLQ